MIDRDRELCTKAPDGRFGSSAKANFDKSFPVTSVIAFGFREPESAISRCHLTSLPSTEATGLEFGFPNARGGVSSAHGLEADRIRSQADWQPEVVAGSTLGALADTGDG